MYNKAHNPAQGLLFGPGRRIQTKIAIHSQVEQTIHDCYLLFLLVLVEEGGAGRKCG